MADKIDKSLTQGPRGSVKLPGEEEVQSAAEEVAVEEQQAPAPKHTPVSYTHLRAHETDS